MLLRSGRARSASLALAVVLAGSTSVVSSFSTQLCAGNRIRVSNILLCSEKKGPAASEKASLFEDYDHHNDGEESSETIASSTTPTTINAQFGESVPLKKPTASFGESVPLKRPGSSSSASGSAGNHFVQQEDTTTGSGFPAAEVEEQPEELKAMKRRNRIVAIASVFLAVSSYVWQFTHPITPVQLLATMQSNSASITTIGTNGKPTVVDFWAPWCENCKMAAPTLQRLEEEYNGQVNFVLVNGDRPEAWPLIERFGVDAIPHVALISADGDVETALIGPIPKRVLEADLDVLLDNAKTKNPNVPKTDLPYKMLDVFANAPEYRRVKFQTTTTDTTLNNK